MSTTEAMKRVAIKVRPVLSKDIREANTRVRALYKAWIRAVPGIVFYNMLPFTEVQVRQKIKEEFDKQKHIKDVRAIDYVVIRSQQELQEITEMWSQPSQIMRYWAETVDPKPKDFLSKFFAGPD